MAALTQFPAQGTPQWDRTVEQILEQLLAEVRRLHTLLSQQRNQVGNLPIDPNTVVT